MFDITNYSDHPTRPGFVIFKFFKLERAEYFEELLKKENVWFESSINESDKTIYFLLCRHTMSGAYILTSKDAR